MKRAFQNKCGSTLRKILLFIYIDISNKIASHKCFATDTALPSICNNHILVRQSSKVFFCFFFFFPREDNYLFFFFHKAWLHIPTAALCLGMGALLSCL